ncbi:MAG: hypothetical protein IKF96_01160 [Eggerthellaceae bacterium]|nr:hypothetical protein [Eggerthellaceae bacterium]
MAVAAHTGEGAPSRVVLSEAGKAREVEESSSGSPAAASVPAVPVPRYRDYTEADVGPVDLKEVMRYAGVPTGAEASAETVALARRAREMAADVPVFRVGYVDVPLTWKDGFPVLPFAQRSADLAKNLAGCDRAIVFAATIGTGFDRTIRRWGRADAALAVMLQGLGAERVEALCDAFCADVKEAAAACGLEARPRFSPGYGDLPLEVQPDLLGLLDASRRLGITLSDSLLMSPTKSVTAIVGLRPAERKCEVSE